MAGDVTLSDLTPESRHNFRRKSRQAKQYHSSGARGDQKITGGIYAGLRKDRERPGQSEINREETLSV